MSAILFDLDGVLYESERPINGAADAVNWFEKNHIPHLFLTNTTSISRLELVEKLSRFGINTKQKEFLTPPVAAKQWLNNHNIKSIALFVPDATKDEFSEFNLITEHQTNAHKIEAVVIGDLGESWTFAIMNQIFGLLMNNPQAKLIALGMTRYWRASSGLQLDVGPMIKAFEYARGIEAVVTGKPAAEFFQAAISMLAQNDMAGIMMIGDDIRGDIEASQRTGLKAIQVRTGKFTASDLELGVTPDAILDSVAQLPQWWRENVTMINTKDCP